MAKKDSGSSELRYTCDQPGCNKSYSRPDHLLRHKLNHDQARVLCCNQCDRTFVRQDLLVRHLERHALRGKTLGRWSNRQKDGQDRDDSEQPSSSNRNSSSPNKTSSRKASSASKSQRRGPPETDSDEEEDPQDVSMEEARLKHSSVARNSASGHDPATYMSFSDANPSPSAWSAFAASPPNPHSTNPPPLFPGGSSAWSPAGGAATSSHPNGGGVSPNIPRNPAAYASASSGSYRSTAAGALGLTDNDNVSPSAAFNHSSHQTSYKDDSMWNDPQTPHHLRIAAAHPNADAVASAQDPNASFRWVPPDELSAEVGGGSYAPPPSAAYFPTWSDSTSQFARSNHPAPNLADLDTSGVARNPSAIPMPNQDIFPFAPPTTDHTADYGWLFDGVDPFGGTTFGGLGRSGASNGRGPQSQASAFSPSSSDGPGGFMGNIHGSNNGAGQAAGNGDASSFGRGMSSDGVLMSGSEVETPNALEDLAYFASLQAEIPSKITYHLDPVAHHRLLIFLQSISELPNSSLFTPSALRCYIYLFFVKFNRLYPLIHEPTFAASTTDPMLLSAIVVIGAHFAGLPAHELAVRIAQKIWGAIVSLEDFRPARATLPMLQAMVLTEAFGKMMSTRPQHEMAHLFHNFIITLARRNAVFNASAVNQSHFEESEDSWRSWAREEEKKRIALFEFMLDAQHATVFRHIPSLSAFQIQLNLPCSDEEWSKTTHESWYRHRKRSNYKPPSPFVPALKACLSPGKTPQELDAFPRFVLLHGIMSIAYDLQWKQNVLLGAENSPGGSKSDAGIGDWKKRLSAAYSSLQARMDIAYIKAEEDPSTRLIYRATPSLVTAAQIALFADIIDIQIYAGLPSVLGRFIDRATFNASRRSVKDWARTSDGRTAVWYAVNFLRTSLLGTGTESYGTIQTFRPAGATSADEASREAAEDRERPGGSPGGKKMSDRESGLDEVLHHRWCQYICALVIWAYGHALSTPRVPPGTAPNTRPSSAHRNGGGSAVQLSSMSLQAPYSNERTQTSPRETEASARPLKPEGVEFLERMSTKAADDIAGVDCKCYTKGVLEMVEKEVRASRWELGREASGVLRKLISNHSMPEWDRTGQRSDKDHNHSNTSSISSGTSVNQSAGQSSTEEQASPQTRSRPSRTNAKETKSSASVKQESDANPE